MKINVNHTAKLAAAIRHAQHGCSARTIDPSEVRATATCIEEILESKLLKQDRPGLRFAVDLNAQSFPASYNGRPTSTQFVLERGSSDWFVTEIQRKGVRGPTVQIEPLNMKDYAEQLASYAAKHEVWTDAANEIWAERAVTLREREAKAEAEDDGADMD